MGQRHRDNLKCKLWLSGPDHSRNHLLIFKRHRDSVKGLTQQSSAAQTAQRVPEAPHVEAYFITCMANNGSVCGSAKQELEQCVGALQRIVGSDMKEDMPEWLANADVFAQLMYSSEQLAGALRALRDALRGMLNSASKEEIACPGDYVVESCEVLGMELPTTTATPHASTCLASDAPRKRSPPKDSAQGKAPKRRR